MDSTSRKTDLWRVVETADKTRACQRKSYNTAPKVQFLLKKIKVIKTPRGGVYSSIWTSLF